MQPKGFADTEPPPGNPDPQIYAPYHGCIHRLPVELDESQLNDHQQWDKMLVHFLQSDVMPLQEVRESHTQSRLPHPFTGPAATRQCTCAYM
jgi:hypothetical protein